MGWDGMEERSLWHFSCGSVLPPLPPSHRPPRASYFLPQAPAPRAAPNKASAEESVVTRLEFVFPYHKARGRAISVNEISINHVHVSLGKIARNNMIIRLSDVRFGL